MKTNFRTHVTSLSLTKLADGLINPKLVLAWLVATLGASATWVGLLVPVREAGALLPQLFTAPLVRATAVRKWWWISGSVLQGLAALAIAVVALTLEGAMAGVIIVGLVGVLALARSISSVSYKDVLGKTVEKTRRGQVSGHASSIAAAGVLVFGLALLFEIGDRYSLVVGVIALAGVLWLVAALNFTRVNEEPSQTERISRRETAALYVSYLREDGELRWFILVRALLVSTAIAPPFLILLGNDDGVFAQLGALVIASSAASLASGVVWGKLSDRSTVRVLTYAGGMAGAALVAAYAASRTDAIDHPLFIPAVLFFLLVAYQGVRIARSTHLTNLAMEDKRATYTALSNTIIGLVLLGTGGFGYLATVLGVDTIVLLLGGLSLVGGLAALRLQPV